MKIALIACCSQKLAHEAPARKLYCSDLFRKARSWSEKHCDEWFILSAAHGLVRPDTILAPYDRILPGLTPPERRQWARQVLLQITGSVPYGCQLVVLAGQVYRQDLIPLLEAAGYTVEVPLQGLGIGQQKAWLKSQLEERP